MARLIFRDSQGREGTVELSPTETVFVGRGLECAIRTDDGMVSRRHAQFRMENGRFVVEDLGSANGTHLNNTRIQKQAVGHADIIQCGSLVIRFVDEGGVNIVSQQGQANMGAGMGQPPPKKGGTMVLDRGDAPPLMGGPPAGNGFPPPSQSGFPPPSQQQPASFGAPPSMPSQFGSSPGSQPNALPYGGPPGMPAGQSSGGSFGGSRGGFGGSAGGASIGTAGTLAQGQPYGGPPSMPSPAPASPGLPYGGPPGMPGGPAAMPSGSGQAPAPGMPFGGPPAMPAGGQGNPSIFGRGGPVGAPQTRPPVDAEKKVLVDLGLEYDPSRAPGEIKQLKTELEKANANYEREVADGKRIRAESATLRDRIEELRAAVKDREEQAAAHDRVADQLREELQQTRDEFAHARQEISEMAENMAARERQAARAQEDAHKIREDMQDLNRQLMELSRTKDEGWKKLNDQLTEIEHLREVINEQERMLEERRVGLMSQEEVIKELRADKEKSLKQIAHLKAERDEATTTATRTQAHVVAIEDENKRLGRLLVESQTEQGRVLPGQGDHVMRLSNDIRDVRVELKKVEADRDRLHEQYDGAERDREKLEGRLAQVEVELQESQHAKLAADSARNVAQDALAKSEVARAKAAEEALGSAKARDAASTGGDDARREVDKLRRRVAEFEKAAAAPAGAAVVDPAAVQREREVAELKVKDLTARAEQAERAAKALQLEIEAAKTDAQKARAEAARAKASADSQAESIIEAVGSPAGTPELARRAKEIYEAINDILSEMRNNMVLVQSELPNLTAAGPTMQAVGDAVEALVDSAETAKGALRGLRDLAESK
ncbi:MAG TPA: FHA domain-containing protein [Kofleriaceae bacterium]|jgi:chromosome segregation ATPase|nr:FHA domain-containing protein [Kofleriaceae bacterium]